MHEESKQKRADLDAPGHRNIARSWGIVYVNEDGALNEEPEAAPVPVAVLAT